MQGEVEGEDSGVLNPLELELVVVKSLIDNKVLLVPAVAVVLQQLVAKSLLDNKLLPVPALPVLLTVVKVGVELSTDQNPTQAMDRKSVLQTHSSLVQLGTSSSSSSNINRKRMD